MTIHMTESMIQTLSRDDTCIAVNVYWILKIQIVLRSLSHDDSRIIQYAISENLTQLSAIHLQCRQ